MSNIQHNNEVLVKVEGLSKKFCKDLKTSLWYGVKDLVSGVRGSNVARELRPKEFWAVKDINFELRRGECLGLIGHNGAGKSTLLKILNGLINPDAGTVTIKGRVGALIELGAGFNPILTGRENIYNNGAILGFSRKEIDTKLQDIIAFSELEEFIDMPVQHYSSGMKVRLGFAVAAQMEPDVLIIDEVLAVGDLGFALKCFNTIDKILPRTAIIFVSHSMPMVSRICNQIILMDKGNCKYKGKNIGEAIDIYYQRFNSNKSQVMFSDNSIELKKIRVENKITNNEFNLVKWGENLELTFEWEFLKEIKEPEFSIMILDKEQRPIAVFDWKNKLSDICRNGNTLKFKLVHKKIQLSKGFYSIDVLVSQGKTRSPHLRINGVLIFQVLHEEEIWPPFLLNATYYNIND
ncbi:polysaccharide ABC transporter ATP-binding protein [Corallibacter sp.]|uniref:ABC transporter ATP-binding protein n=1 Tax=Corallibacter sp. TaxID=2038084 RepID=UPI003AB90C71